MRYETRLSPAEVLERLQAKLAEPVWGVSLPKLIQYRIMTGRITGNEFKISRYSYGLTHGRMSYLLMVTGSVKKDKQSGVTIINLMIQPPEPVICFYIIFSILMIFAARYGIKQGDVLMTLMSIVFIIGPYLSLLIQLPRSIDVYQRFIEQDILGR